MTMTMTDYDIPWLLKGQPRLAQLEALSRSYQGRIFRNTKDDEPSARPIRSRAFDERGFARGWAHFLEPRVGKTPTLLNEFMLLRKDHGFESAVIFAPNKYKLDWTLEAERFGIDVPAYAFESTNRDDAVRFVNKNRKGFLLSANWEAATLRETCEFLETIVGPKTIIVGDESIEIKGHKSIRTVNALKIAANAGARRVLSGKPIVQGPADIWAQLRFCGAIDGFVYHAFKTVFSKMGGFKGRKVVGVQNEERFHAILDEWSWFARKIDWLKTPGRDYMECEYKLLPEQLCHYTRMQDEFLTELSDGTLVVADQIVTKLLKLQQIASGFIIDENGKPHDIMSPGLNPKINYVKNIIEGEVTGKAIVIAHFTHSIEMLAEALKEYNPAVIKGRASPEQTVAAKAQFNNDKSCRVIIGQAQAIRYGHTLMGNPDDPCHDQIFFENDYNLNTRVQCEERAQGEGQSAPITMRDLFATKHDLAPIRALQRKEDMVAILMRYDRMTGLLPPKPEAPQQ